jgi:hypothetical protein
MADTSLKGKLNTTSAAYGGEWEGMNFSLPFRKGKYYARKIRISN